MNKLFCINCPNGCQIMVMEIGPTFEIVGNGCEKGFDFAKAETENPVRSLTTTVRTTLPGVPVLPVRTDGEIPKGKVMEAMRALAGVTVSVGLELGDTVVEDVEGSGVRVIAASDLLRHDAPESGVKNAGLEAGSAEAALQNFGSRSLKSGALGPNGEHIEEDEALEEVEDGDKEEPGDQDAQNKSQGAALKPSQGKALLRH